MEKLCWKKPELIILISNRPEEAVLESCKGDGSSSEDMSVNECHKYDCSTDSCMVISSS